MASIFSDGNVQNEQLHDLKCPHPFYEPPESKYRIMLITARLNPQSLATAIPCRPPPPLFPS
jgi:hypothetical protein